MIIMQLLAGLARCTGSVTNNMSFTGQTLNISVSSKDSGKKFDTMANISILCGNCTCIVTLFKSVLEMIYALW